MPVERKLKVVFWWDLIFLIKNKFWICLSFQCCFLFILFNNSCFVKFLLRFKLNTFLASVYYHKIWCPSSKITRTFMAHYHKHNYDIGIGDSRKQEAYCIKKLDDRTAKNKWRKRRSWAWYHDRLQHPGYSVRTAVSTYNLESIFYKMPHFTVQNVLKCIAYL